MKAFWYKGDWTDDYGNVGDILTPVIVKHLTGKTAKYTLQGERLLSIGSIAEFIKEGDVVWGSGLIEPMRIPLSKDVTILAVRGRNTAQILRKIGYDVPEVYGSPAIIMPDIYHPQVEPIYKTGYVPHYVEIEAFKAKYPKGHYISIINSVEDFIFQILECEKIITSSLHAYILAEAYGVECHYIQLTDKIIGGMFKFKDYMTADNDKEQLINTFNQWYNNVNLASSQTT